MLKMLLIAMIVSVALSGEVVDRVAVIVGRTVITESEIMRQIRLAAFQNNEPVDASNDNKRATAEKLVEQALIRREIESNRYALGDLPDPEVLVKQFKSERFPSEEAYQAALKKYGISEAELREHLVWQATLIPFIDIRFRPSVQITPSDVKDYYERELLPKWSSLTEKPPSLEEATPSIESILTAERADHALDRWLGQMRTQTRIRFLPEVFR